MSKKEFLLEKRHLLSNNVCGQDGLQCNNLTKTILTIAQLNEEIQQTELLLDEFQKKEQSIDNEISENEVNKHQAQREIAHVRDQVVTMKKEQKLMSATKENVENFKSHSASEGLQKAHATSELKRVEHRKAK